MSQEIELKLVFTQVLALEDVISGLKQVLPVPGFEQQPLRNIYFDTVDRRLNQARIALRIREKHGCFIQTLKTKGAAVEGLHQRGEWEWSLVRPVLDVDILRQHENWPDDIDPSALQPVFETNFMRHAAELEFMSSRIELAIDIGEIIAGDRREDLQELELELLSGSVSAVLELGQKLKQCLPLESSDISKAERGYRLAGL